MQLSGSGELDPPRRRPWRGGGGRASNGGPAVLKRGALAGDTCTALENRATPFHPALPAGSLCYWVLPWTHQGGDLGGNPCCTAWLWCACQCCSPGTGHQPRGLLPERTPARQPRIRLCRPHVGSPGAAYGRSWGTAGFRRPRGTHHDTVAARAPPAVGEADKVFEVDPLRCTCGGTMRVIAFILDAPVIRKILQHRPRPNERAHAPPPG